MSRVRDQVQQWIIHQHFCFICCILYHSHRVFHFALICFFVAPSEKYVSAMFMKKYIHVARVLKPILTRDACDVISTEYAKLRAQDTTGTDRAKVRVT